MTQHDPVPDPAALVAPPQTTTADTFAHEVATIRRRLDLPTSASIRYEDEGWDSRVYLVDGGAAVFKFPRDSAVRDQYAREVAVLHALEPVELPVWVPTVTWEGPDLEYFGYEGMQGASPVLADLDRSGRVRLGEAIGGFARILHGLDLPFLADVTVDDELRDLRARWEAAVPIVERHFDRSEFARLDHLFGATVPDGWRRLGTDPVPCHGDLGPWNVILAPDGRVGVIDFGDAMRTDGAQDLCGLDDAIALDAALAVYGHDGPVLREKIELRAVAALLMDLLFFAGKRDDARLAVCCARVRRVIADR